MTLDRKPVLVADHSGWLTPAIATLRPVVEAADRASALREAARIRPAVAVVVADLPPEGGVSLAGQLVASGVRVVLAVRDDTGPVVAALRAGVRVVVDPEQDGLDGALAAAERGDVLLGRRLAAHLPAVAAPSQTGQLGLAPKTARRRVARILAPDPRIARAAGAL